MASVTRLSTGGGSPGAVWSGAYADYGEGTPVVASTGGTRSRTGRRRFGGLLAAIILLLMVA